MAGRQCIALDVSLGPIDKNNIVESTVPSSNGNGDEPDEQKMRIDKGEIGADIDYMPSMAEKSGAAVDYRNEYYFITVLRRSTCGIRSSSCVGTNLARSFRKSQIFPGLPPPTQTDRQTDHTVL